MRTLLPKRLIAVSAGLSMLACRALGEVTLPAIFSEHMVLQSGVPVPVWGWARAGEEVSVSIGGQTRTAKAGADKKWSVKLDPLSEGGPQTMTVKGINTIEISDVLVGEVWLCSGQSNMAFTVDRALNFEREKSTADLPTIRIFTVLSGSAPQPEAKCEGHWVVCSPETVGTFSAVGFFFGRELHSRLRVPVGLVHSAVSGTVIEAWTSMEAQQDAPELKFIFDEWEKRLAAGESRKDPNRPGNLFNGKIAPLIPYAIRGAIWYQGESSAETVERGAAYRVQLPLLIADWRRRWGREFPFAWVQLPEIDPRNPMGWVLVREAMLKSLTVPKTGMAVALGLGDAKDIHPKQKQGIGTRLAAWALADVYATSAEKGSPGEPLLAMGPLYAAHTIAGAEVTVTFTQAAGLMAKDGDVKGFVIAGEDREWKPATARIVEGRVVVSSPEVPAPRAVRYAWAGNPEFSLFNRAGLPASPFRTDDWPMTTPAQ